MLRSKEGTDDTLAERIAFCMWRLWRGAIAEGKIIRSYTKLDGINWHGLLKSGYLWKIFRYERRIVNYLNRLLKEFKDRSRTQKVCKQAPIIHI